METSALGASSHGAGFRALLIRDMAQVLANSISVASPCRNYSALPSLNMASVIRTSFFGASSSQLLAAYGPVETLSFKVSTKRSNVLAEVKITEGSVLAAEDLRFALVAARFNEIITKPLVTGALETFHRYAIKDDHVEVIWVPGSFEIPVVAQTLAKSGKYDAIVCIGAVIRGATTHYDAVANSAASGIMSASINSGIPCIFGVLTCDNMEQAMDRAGGKVGNKGGEAAITAIEMASLGRQLKVQLKA